MVDIKQILNKYADIALSDKEVLKLINGRANLILYPDLHKYTSIDQILEPYGACILLYEAKPRYGHWCCIFKVNDRLLEYFNPYGGFHEGFPDESLEYIPMDFRLKSHQYYPYLSMLMYNSPYQLSYNEYPFQKHNQNIKTCGRWCAIRIVFKNYSLNEFSDLIKFLKKKLNINSDQLVTLLTMYINK
jgi:hypothetical protein